jgi:hypothetical protein
VWQVRQVAPHIFDNLIEEICTKILGNCHPKPLNNLRIGSNAAAFEFVMNAVGKCVPSLMKPLFRHYSRDSVEDASMTFPSDQLVHAPIYSRAKGRAENKKSDHRDDDVQSPATYRPLQGPTVHGITRVTPLDRQTISPKAKNFLCQLY